MSRLLATIVLVSLGLALPAAAEDYTVERSPIPIMKPVYGQVQSRDIVPARARIGGTLVEIHVEEGDAVKAGDMIANVVDEKLALQLNAIDARQEAISAQLENARANVERARQLFERGTIAKTRLDEQQTQFDVLVNQLDAIEADKSVIVQQAREGTVNAPSSGRVLSVPVTQGSVILPGETIARIAGGGYFLRLSLPERHAAGIAEGDTVEVGARGLNALSPSGKTSTGHVVKVYPEIAEGRVIVDVDVDKLGDFFVGERTLVSIPVGSRQGIIVPAEALITRHGIDYVRVREETGVSDVTVIPGKRLQRDGQDHVEILTGLHSGDEVVLP